MAKNNASKVVELTRRALLRATCAATPAFFGTTLMSSMARAAARVPDRYFVFAYFAGGWDLLLGLDPRDPVEFDENRVGTTQIQPGYSRLKPYGFPSELVTGKIAAGQMAPLVFGPAAGDLADVSDEVSVFRGINMETLAHQVGYRYFLTGRTPSGINARGSSIAAEIAAQLGATAPLPNLAHTEETYADGLPGYAGAVRINQLSDLLLALRPSRSTLPEAVRVALANREAARVGCAPEIYDSAGLLTAYRESQKSARQMVTSGLGERFDFSSASADMAAFRTRFGLTSDFDGPNGQAALAARAIIGGVSQVVSVRLATGLDTHFNDWAATHSRQLSTGFGALARLIRELKSTPHASGGNYLDRTVVCAFSEFGRTPMLNDRGGRDHFLGNACLVAGGGIKKGRVFGASSNFGLAPRLINLTTGEASATGKSLHPEHVLATVMAAAKLDSAFLRVDPIADALTS